MLLAAKFNDDMKRDKIKELIEVILCSNMTFMVCTGLKKVVKKLPYPWKVEKKQYIIGIQ